MSTILGKEWRLLAADRSLGPLLLLLAFSVGYGLWNGSRWARRQERSIRLAAEAVDADLAELRANVARFERRYPEAGPAWDLDDPRQKGVKGLSAGTLAVSGDRAALSPGPLAALSVGQGDMHPSHTKVSLWNNRHDLFGEAEHDNPLQLLNGRFDLAFVVVYLCPLFLLGLGYSLLSAEREGGTLAMVLSQPVRLGPLVARRAGLVLAVVVVPLLALTGIGIALAGLPVLEPGTPARLLAWGALVVAYGLFWVALAVAVNILGFGSSANAMALACAWLGLVLVVPGGLNLAITTAFPVPSRVEYIQALRRAANESESSAAILRERYYEEHPEMRPRDDGGGPKVSIHDYWLQKWGTARRMEPVLDRYERALARQEGAASACRYLSPAMLAQDAMNALAGTDPGRYRDFRDEAARFQRNWHAYFAPRMFQNLRMTGEDYRRFPRFAMPPGAEGRSIGRAAADLGGIVAATALLVGLTALRRYPVTA